MEDDTNIDTLMQEIAPKKPDLLEIRLDRLRGHRSLEKIVKGKTFPIIATDRSDRDQLDKLQQLSYAASVGFDFVDLDYDATDEATIKLMRSKGADVILSYHDYSGTAPKEELTKILEAEKSLGGDICKLVTTARLPHDNLTVLGFLESQSTKGRLVSFAMGKQGTPSRILSPLFGAEFTFAALSDKTKTAEGQLSIEELRSAWHILGLQ